MREKIIQLMSLTLTPVNEAITNITNDWKQKLFNGPGGLTQAETNAINTIEAALRANASGMFEHLIDMYTTNFAEEEIDVQIEYWTDKRTSRLKKISPKILETTNQILADWYNDSTKPVEPELSKIFSVAIAKAYPESAETIAAAAATSTNEPAV
jgi:hypothetical protein